MKVQFLLLSLLLVCGLEATASDFPCPDEHSREMYARLQELKEIDDWLEPFRVFWEDRLDRLGVYPDKQQK